LAKYRCIVLFEPHHHYYIDMQPKNGATAPPHASLKKRASAGISGFASWAKKVVLPPRRPTVADAADLKQASATTAPTTQEHHDIDVTVAPSNNGVNPLRFPVIKTNRYGRKQNRILVVDVGKG
jgi:hypothetical protein